MRKRILIDKAQPGGNHTLESLASSLELFSVTEAATILRCSQRAVRQLLGRNLLDVQPGGPGGENGITAASLALYLREQAPEPAAGLDVSQGLAQPATLPPTVLLEAVKPRDLPCRPLIQVLNEVEDFRFQRGRRYRLATLLAFACAAMMCGCQTHAEIVQWGQDHRQLIVNRLGVHRPPSIRTIRLIFRGLDPRELNAHLQLWCSNLVEAMANHVGVEWPREPFYKNRRSLLASLRKRSRVVGSDSLVALGRRVGLHRVADHSLEPAAAEEVVGLVLECLLFKGEIAYVAASPAPLKPETDKAS